MKIHLIFSIIILFFSNTIVYSQSIEITHYNLQFEIIPNKHKLIAESEVIIKSNEKEFPKTIELSLNYVNINMVSDIHGKELNYSKENGKVIIKPNQVKNENDDIVIKLNYEGVFQGWVSNRIDTNSSWLLHESNYYPQLENQNNNQKFTYDVKVTVPDSITVVCPGSLVKIDTSENKRSFYYCSTKPEYFFSIFAAVYNIKESNNSGIKIKTFLFHEHQAKSDTLIKLFSKALNFYQERFGQYPLSEFKIIETDRRGGYAPSGQMILSSKIINKLDDIGFFTIAHEVAHQWFPHKTMFFPDYYLNESFAQYASISYLESMGIMANKIENIKKKLLFLTLGFDGTYNEFFRFKDHYVFEDKPISEVSIKDGRLYKWAAYYKGFYFLRSLASTVGIDTFNSAIKNIIECNNKSSISVYDLISSVSKESGKDLIYQITDWINTNKILDYDLSYFLSEKLSSGKYKTTVYVNNLGEISVPFEVSVITNNGKELFTKINHFSDNKATYEFISNGEVVKAEIDPKWFLLDANRINNIYPRKKNISFLVSTYNLTKEQYFYYPSITFGQRDNIRLGLWFTNIYTIFPEFLNRNLTTLKWRAGLFYGSASKRIGYYLDFETFLGMPSYRWNWGMNLSNYRGAENYDIFLNHILQKDENHGKHNILTLSINRNLIYDMAYYDDNDFEDGINTTLSFNWNRIFRGEKENITAKFGKKLVGNEYSFSKISVELENFLPISYNWLSYRIFGGIIRGNYPKQEAIYLSGGVYPSSFAYWFVDPDNNISTQENLHLKGGSNLRGYIGRHIYGKNGLSMNFDLFLPKYNFFKLFVDVGNVWDKHLKSFKYDLGIGLDFKMIRVDFPFYINDPVGNEKNIAFRWLIEFNSIL